ncbi:MAG: NAD-dependent malic enzyme [Candidatus Competibacteraceae bacterium]
MNKKFFDVERTPEGDVYRVHARGQDVLTTPLLNRGSAFTPEERAALNIAGLLPAGVSNLDQQAARAYEQYQDQPSGLAKHVYLTALHDRNEVLFYRLVCDHMHEMFPIIYDPVIGEAIRKHSHIYRRPRGLYLSVDEPDAIDSAFDNLGFEADDVDLVVCSDAEEILGIGDWGIGGIDIAIGKLAVYTAAAGIDPARVIPVGLDVGTDREALLNDPMYMGNRHARVRGAQYDEFIDRFVRAVTQRFPNALLHWEDFGPSNARRLLNQYRSTVCTFNDDMQGTGAISLAAVLSGARATGVPLGEHRIVVFGAGTAGVGFAEQIRDAMMLEGVSEQDAKSRIWCLASHGLLVHGMPAGMRDFQEPYARHPDEVAAWQRDAKGQSALDEVVRQVKPTVLVGTSTRPGAFTETIVREMAQHCARPMILPLSNPTELHEAKPVDLIHWTDGRALVATGAPFAPVTYRGVTYVIPQANNAMLYPGLGLGIITARARLVTDAMIAAAARAVSEMSDLSHPGAPLLPLVSNLRQVSAVVGIKVAQQAIKDGVARVIPNDVETAIKAAMWQPVYPKLI